MHQRVLPAGRRPTTGERFCQQRPAGRVACPLHRLRGTAGIQSFRAHTVTPYSSLPTGLRPAAPRPCTLLTESWHEPSSASAGRAEATSANVRRPAPAGGGALREGGCRHGWTNSVHAYMRAWVCTRTCARVAGGMRAHACLHHMQHATLELGPCAPSPPLPPVAHCCCCCWWRRYSPLKLVGLRAGRRNGGGRAWWCKECGMNDDCMRLAVNAQASGHLPLCPRDA